MEIIKVLQNIEERFDYALYSTAREKENRLSDVVWAMCQSDEVFLRTFFFFCFCTEDTNIKLYGIDREVCHGSNGRNDFNIHTSKGIYIVESKIGDPTINVDKYLNIVNEDKGRITYIVPKNWSGDRKQLDGIKLVYWEDFIELYNWKYTFFTRKADMILNIEDKYLPPKEFVKDEICIIEDFKSKFFSENKYFGEQTDNWTDKNNPCYGYRCWASVWFGIYYTPLKGVFFCFTIGKKGGDRTPEDSNELGPFQNVIKLGELDKENHYYEVQIDNIKNMTTEILDEAFREFADKINVKEYNEEIPLLKYINYKIP